MTNPRILLLGDSIRMSYQPLVAHRMMGRADITGPADNCRFALYTSMRKDAWISECGKPDIVHWNNGIWDCGRNNDHGPAQFSIADYLINLRVILKYLRKFTPRIIWASSTPVHPKRDNEMRSNWAWANADIDAYNAAAADLMRGENIPINDLNAVIKANYDGFLDTDLLHLTPAGRDACADAVVAAVDRLAAEEESK